MTLDDFRLYRTDPAAFAGAAAHDHAALLRAGGFEARVAPRRYPDGLRKLLVSTRGTPLGRVHVVPSGWDVALRFHRVDSKWRDRVRRATFGTRANQAVAVAERSGPAPIRGYVLTVATSGRSVGSVLRRGGVFVGTAVGSRDLDPGGDLRDFEANHVVAVLRTMHERGYRSATVLTSGSIAALASGGKVEGVEPPPADYLYMSNVLPYVGDMTGVEVRFLEAFLGAPDYRFALDVASRRTASQLAEGRR